jgi:cyclopropane fatty-acyl-phospholipid synthase-like methyltransferase
MVPPDIEQELGVQELRARLLEHTRNAFAKLPLMDRPRILDIGCGDGLPTMELARMSRGEVVGIDIDESALSRFRQRIEESDLADRVTVQTCSLFETGVDAGSFDILWEEGVLHLLDPAASFTECHRLLKPGGFLVMHERLSWFAEMQPRLSEWGLAYVDQYPLPRHFWWTDYGAPLEARITSYRKSHADAADSDELNRLADVAASIKADPDQFDCAFFILQKPDNSSD